MYKRQTIYSSDENTSISRFVENIDGVDDLANSSLLYLLDEETDVSTYLITKYEHRIDQISKDIYGDEKYGWILLYYNRLSIKDLVRGTTIDYLPVERINSILSSL